MIVSQPAVLHLWWLGKKRFFLSGLEVSKCFRDVLLCHPTFHDVCLEGGDQMTHQRSWHGAVLLAWCFFESCPLVAQIGCDFVASARRMTETYGTFD
jgi:hypothetical protein